MSVVINTNSAATVASNNLAASNAGLQRSLNRLSSGSKIVNPSDAAATNIGNATSYLQTQDGVLKVAGKILDRMSELATLYGDNTKNSDDIANYSAEFTQLTSELTNLSQEKFNGIALFGSTDLTVKTNEDGSQAVTATAVDLSGDTSSVD